MDIFRIFSGIAQLLHTARQFLMTGDLEMQLTIVFKMTRT